MRAFYLLILGFGGLLLFLSLALYLMFGIRELNAPEQLQNRLGGFSKQGVLPRNVTMLLGNCVMLGACGWIITVHLSMPWFVSLPCAAISCGLVNWAGNLLLYRDEPPLKLSDDLIEGLNGKVVEEITQEFYGKVEFYLRERKYTVNAVNAGVGSIPVGEEVILISHSEDLYFVVAESHVYDLVDL